MTNFAELQPSFVANENEHPGDFVRHIGAYFEGPKQFGEKFPYLSLDIETLDNKPTSAIASIGGVYHNKEVLGPGFYIRINIEEYDRAEMKSLFTIGTSTMRWWLTQSESARQELTKAGGVAPMDAAIRLEQIMKVASELTPTSRSALPGSEATLLKPSTKIIANGPQFDYVIVEHFFRSLLGRSPMKHNVPRDMKSILEEHPNHKWLPVQGTAHNAVDDAISQARNVIAAWNS